MAVDRAKELAAAASGSRLEVVPGNANGVELIKDGERVHGEVRSFVGGVMPIPAFERWLWPAGVAVLVPVVLGVVVLRRRNTTTPADVSADN